MLWQYQPYALPLFFGGFTLLGLALLMYKWRRLPGATTFVQLLIAITVWSLTLSGELMSADSSSILLWDKATYIGIVSVPVTFLAFAIEGTGHKEWLRKRIFACLSFVPAVTLLLDWTNETHHLIYKATLVSVGGSSILEKTWGIGFWIFLAYAYVLASFGVGLFVQQLLRSRNGTRQQTAILILGPLMPFTASLFDVSSAGVYHIHWTPMALIFMAMAYFWALFILRLFDITQIAREAIMRGMSDGVIILSARNDIVDINSAGEKIFGCEARKIHGKNITDLFKLSGLSGDAMTNGLKEITLAGGVFDVTFSPLLDHCGGVVGKISVIHDITDLKRTEEELRISEARLKTIIDSSPFPIAVSDVIGKIIDCNQTAADLLHYSSKAELIGKNVISLFAEKDEKIATDNFKRMLKLGPGYATEYLLATKNGHEFPAELSASVVRDARRNPIACVMTAKDLTFQKQYEDKLRKAQRMAAIGETAAMVGHDLRNPLQAIMGATYILRAQFGSTSNTQTKRMLDLIENCLAYSNKIVEDLLDYSRDIRLELAETTPKAVTEAALLQVKIPQNVTIENLTEDTPRLRIDVMKTQRVFVNLIRNAIDAMPNGGKITLTSSESNGTITFKFIDTGEGISDEVMQNLWKPLRTTKAKGLGLGLAICKRIVETHDGTVQVESTPGEGSTFTIRLPIKQKMEDEMIKAQPVAMTIHYAGGGE